MKDNNKLGALFNEQKRGRRGMRHEEHDHAVALNHWWTLEANRRGLDPRLLIHVANEGRVGGGGQIRRGFMLKQEGVRAGTPDYLLAIPNTRTESAGLWIELKAPKGRTSISQDEMLKELAKQGYSIFIAYGWDSARHAIINYLS